MLKNLEKLFDVKTLSKVEQSKISGGDMALECLVPDYCGTEWCLYDSRCDEYDSTRR